MNAYQRQLLHQTLLHNASEETGMPETLSLELIVEIGVRVDMQQGQVCTNGGISANIGNY